MEKLAAMRASRERPQLSVTGSSPHEGRELLGCFPLTFHGFAALEDCFLLMSPLLLASHLTKSLNIVENICCC